MAFKLDDFLSKKKEPTQVLDLSKVKITTKEEFKKYLDKVPEFKIKPEKVAPENIRIRDKDFSFSSGKRGEKQTKEWSFPDPVPPDMAAVKLEDLCPVNIDWKMLTTLRPKTKVEEEMFSRLVQLGKLDLKYQQALKREKSTDWIRKTKNPRSSIVEVRVLSCKECGEDFCDGTLCSKFMYDNFSRSQANGPGEEAKSFKLPEAEKSSKKKKHKRKSRRRKRSRIRGGKLKKNSIFTRAPTRGCSRDHTRRGSHAKAESLRSSSLNRIQLERKPVLPKMNRSKSAPRLQYKRDVPDPAFASRSEYASDSVPTQTDYSSQSDSESCRYRYSSSESPKRRQGRQSGHVGFVEKTESCCRGRKKIRGSSHSESEAAGYESNNSFDADSDRSKSNSRSPEKTTSRPDSKYPTTIQIKFDGFHPTSSMFYPRKSYAPNKFSHSKRGAPVTTLKNQEITKIMEGFTKIDLSFTDDEPSSSNLKTFPESMVVSPKRISFYRHRARTVSQSSRLKGRTFTGK